MQRTCAALEEQGFFAVRTMECLLRQYEVRQERFAALGDDLQGPQQCELYVMLHVCISCNLVKSTWPKDFMYAKHEGS